MLEISTIEAESVWTTPILILKVKRSKIACLNNSLTKITENFHDNFVKDIKSEKV